MSRVGRWVGCWAVALLLGVPALAATPGSPVESPRPGYRFSFDPADDVRSRLADGKRDEAIDQLRALLPGIDDASPEKPDLIFQLAELYWEKHRSLYAREERAHERALAARKVPRPGASAEPEPPADHRESDRQRLEAMELYRTILSRYPSYGRTDDVLFSLAYNLHEMGEGTEAARRYLELVQRFPSSRFAPDAWVQLGEHAFDHNDLEGARRAFQHAVKSGEPRIYSYALYKLAWCDFNARDLEGALKKLQQVVDYALGRGRVLVDLRNEALSDLVALYVALNRPEEAQRYFAEKATPAQRPRLITRLADGLLEAGHDDGALQLYARLIAEDPSRPEAPLFQRSRIRALAKLGRRSLVLDEVKVLVDRYRPGSPWWQRNAGNKAVLREAFDACEEALRELSVDYHKEAQETRQVGTFRLARDLYRRYLDAFASSDDPEWVADAALNQAFFHAEVLWALEEWEPAYEAYERVVRFQVPDRPGAREVSRESYRKLAAFDAVLAADRLLKIERGQEALRQLQDSERVDVQKVKARVDVGSPAPGKVARPGAQGPLTAGEERLVRACDSYVQLFPAEQAPADERARAIQEETDIRYQAAVIFADRDRTGEAVRRLVEIADRWPEEPRAQAAADLAMSLLESRQEWAELARLSGRLVANPRLVKPGTPFGRHVQRVLEGARYKWIDEVVVKKEKDPARAVEELRRYVREMPRSAYADRALTYAMLLDRDRHELEQAVATGERALAEYPGSPLEPKIRYTLCTLYERLADLPNALRMAESFIDAHDRRRAGLEQARRRGPEGAEPGAGAGEREAAGTEAERIAEEAALLEEAEAWLPEAQASAALWHEGLGEPERAIAAYQRYLSRFGRRPEAPRMQYAIGLLLERERRWVDAARAFEKFESAYGRDPRVKPHQVLLATYRRLLASRAAGETARAEKLAAEVVRAYQRLDAETRQEPGVAEAHAHARFLQVEPLWRKYVSIQFRRIATVRRDLEQKRKALRELERSYLAVLQLGVGEWGIAALARLGNAYADLARGILDSPTPRGLTQAEKALYREELEKLALPLEDQALEALDKALARAYELSIYGEWTRVAQDLVNELRPGSYPEAREVRLPAWEEIRAAELDRSPLPAGAAAFDAGRLDEAKRLFEEALRSDRKDAAARYDLGVIAEREGDLQAAERAYRAAAEVAPLHPRVLPALSQVLRRQGRAAEAVALLQVAVLGPGLAGDVSLLNALAAAQRSSGQQAQAEATARRVLARSSENPEAHRMLALCALDRGHPNLAELHALAARKRAEGDAAVAGVLGLVYLRLEDRPRALSELRQALVLDPSFAPAHLQLGALALASRDYGTAERSFARVLALEPESRSVLLMRARALDGLRAREPRRGVDAGAAFEQVLAFQPDDPEATCGAGFGYGADRAGFERAIPHLEKCQRLAATPGERQAAQVRLEAIRAVLSAGEGEDRDRGAGTEGAAVPPRQERSKEAVEGPPASPR